MDTLGMDALPWKEQQELGAFPMSVTLDLPKDVEAALASQARAAQMPTDQYLAKIVEHAVALRRRRAADELARQLDVMASHVPPETTQEQMETAPEEALAAVRPKRNWQP